MKQNKRKEEKRRTWKELIKVLCASPKIGVGEEGMIKIKGYMVKLERIK